MIRTYKTEGIVIARRNSGEADKLITVFTKEYGKKKVLAKGVRRINSRRSPFLELCSHVALVLHRGKVFDTITEVAPIETFSYLRRKLERIAFAYIALELTDKLTAEAQESEVIFFHLRQFLSDLNRASATRKSTAAHLSLYKQELLGELGFIQKEVVLQDAVLDRTIETIIEQRVKSVQLLTSIQRSL